MPLVKDEQEVKKETQFLEYETGDMGNELMLKSNLYRIPSHYVSSVKRSVLCRGKDECQYCNAGYRKNSEFNYRVFLNGQLGFINIKASVFFAIQGISKAQKKDPRQISWTVIKKGEGLNTEYITSKNDNLGKEDYDRVLEELEGDTKKLSELMEKREKDLEQNYSMYLSEIKGQEVPAVSNGTKGEKVKAKAQQTAPIAEDIPGEEQVSPEEMPF